MSEHFKALESNQRTPPPITAEEFDARFEAGEDLSEYFDWDTAVMVQPGELSPGQKLSMIQGMIDDLLKTIDAPRYFASTHEHLDVPLSSLMFIEVGREAARHGISREELVQSWIEQKLAEQKTSK